MKFYAPKIIVAWAEAMKGNEKIGEWLLNNGFPELMSCIASLKGNQSADKWLFQNGHPELVALVEYVNGQEEAGSWLVENKFDVLFHVSQYVLEEDDALSRLASVAGKEYLILAQCLKRLVDDVDFDTNDVHKSPIR